MDIELSRTINGYHWRETLNYTMNCIYIKGYNINNINF
jgi:hypothetical protein